MRLTSLTLSQYGNFASERITLDPAPGRLNLIVAPNGAGKSVVRQAFGDLLFGIGLQSPMSFRFATKGMRLFAEALAPDGSALQFGRRKGQGVTLVDAAGEKLSPTLLDGVLRSAQRPLLEQLFALDTERLRHGGAELLASGGSLADALLAAAGGLRQANALRQHFAEARDALAPIRRSEKRPLYRALDGLMDARKQKRTATQRPEDRHRREATLAVARAGLDAANSRYREHATTRSRLERMRRVRPILAELDAARSWLEANRDAPVLPSDLPQRLADAREALRRATDAVADYAKRCEQAATAARLIAPDAAILAEAPTVASLLDVAGAARQATDDLPACEGKLRETESRIATLLKDLSSDLPVAQAASLRVPRPAIKAARRLIEQHARLNDVLRGLPGRIAIADRTRDELEAAIAAVPQYADMKQLAAVVREVRADGDPGAQRTKREQGLATCAAIAAEALAQVPGWSGGTAALGALGMPASSLLDMLDRANADASHALAAARAALAATTADQAKARRELADLSRDRTLPESSAIEAARRHRDAGWHLVFRQAFQVAPTDREIAAWSPGPLPLAYERAVIAADDLADRRVEESTRLAEAQQLERHSQLLEERQSDLMDRVDAAGKHAMAALADWQEVCAAMSLPGASSRDDLREFAVRRNNALQAAREHQDAAAQLAELRDRHSGWCRRLAEATQPGPTQDCSGHLLTAEAMLEAADAAGRDRALMASQLKPVTEQLGKLQEEFTAQTALMQEWRAAWAGSQAALGGSSGQTPDAVADRLDLLGELDQEVDRALALQERTQGMHERITDFDLLVRELARRLGVSEPDPQAALRAMSKLLTQAQDLASRRDELERAIRIAESEHALATDRVSHAETELHAVMAAAGAATDEQADHRIALSTARSLHQKQAVDAELRLHAGGDGLSLEQLREEAGSLPADEGAAALAEEELERAREAAQTMAAEVSRVEQELARETDAAAVLGFAAAEASNLATLSRIVEDALLQHVAGVLLERAMASVETGGDSKLIERIGAVFRSLTNGAYASISVRENERGAARLVVAEHAFPDEEARELDQLSEGTRDQLYLALRLVAIEDYVTGGSPALPFIADDILQTFDDPRATAALRTLTTFSRTAQVIVLTHHEHILALVGTLPPGSVHVHRLHQEAALA